MTKIYAIAAGTLALLSGCASVTHRPVPLPPVVEPTAASSAHDFGPIQLVAYQQPETLLPEPADATEPLATPSSGLTLDALEQMALAGNPSTAQAAARVRALRGKWCQVGLPMNPTIGYVAGEIGNEGGAGQHGAFAGQEFIRGGKLELNRCVVAAEIQQAEQVLAATQRRVLTDLRKSFYLALVAEQRVAMAEKLLNVNKEAVDASKQLLKAQEIPLAGLLQTEVEQQNTLMQLRTARNGAAATWRRLSAVVGDVDLPPQPLAGDASQLPDDLRWEEELDRVTSTSPEIAAAMSNVTRAQRALQRACAEPVPNISTQLSVQYDDSTSDTIAGVQVGMPLPLWNRNQGGICQAKAEVAQASRNVQRVELQLKQRLAATFRDYANARAQVETYKQQILPRAAKTLDLVQRGYRLGEVGYLDLLNAQRTYSTTNLQYLDAVASLWENWALIDGLLLDGSLSEPRQ